MKADCLTCEGKGHFYKEGSMHRCDCLQDTINKRALGTMYCPNIRSETPLSEKVYDLVITGPLNQVRPHVARVLADRHAKRQSFKIVDAYRLIEIFLGQDDDYDTMAPLKDTGLLVIMLGFADPRNRYLPELVLQILSRRELSGLPTWVILGVPMNTIPHKYSSELTEKLQQFEKVVAE